MQAVVWKQPRFSCTHPEARVVGFSKDGRVAYKYCHSCGYIIESEAEDKTVNSTNL